MSRGRHSNGYHTIRVKTQCFERFKAFKETYELTSSEALGILLAGAKA